MANRIVMTKLGPRADEILDAFEQDTGLSADDEGERRVFHVESPEEHQLDVVQTLDELDSEWESQIGFDSPLTATD